MIGVVGLPVTKILFFSWVVVPFDVHPIGKCGVLVRIMYSRSLQINCFVPPRRVRSRLERKEAGDRDAMFLARFTFHHCYVARTMRHGWSFDLDRMGAGWSESRCLLLWKVDKVPDVAAMSNEPNPPSHC